MGKTPDQEFVVSPSEPNLRARLRAGETTYGVFLNLGSPLAAELCARGGSDWLIIDLEHGAAGESDLLEHLYAVSATETTAIVRPASVSAATGMPITCTGANQGGKAPA